MNPDLPPDHVRTMAVEMTRKAIEAEQNKAHFWPGEVLSVNTSGRMRYIDVENQYWEDIEDFIESYGCNAQE